GGSGYASFVLGLMASFSNTPVSVPAYYRWHYYAGYIQDDFKIRRNLTLNLGVRYEFETPRYEKYDNQGTFVPNISGTLNGIPVAPLTSAFTSLQGARGPIFSLQGITVPYIDQSNAVPYIQQWGFTLQFMLSQKTLLQTGYNGMVGTHLVSGGGALLNYPNMN